jgi:hypothetical protein
MEFYSHSQKPSSKLTGQQTCSAAKLLGFCTHKALIPVAVWPAARGNKPAFPDNGGIELLPI